MKTCLSLLVLLLALALPLPALAQDGGGRLPDGAPGFAIGAYGNGHTYAIAQTFQVPDGGTYYGAVLAFGETQGTPTGAVRWQVRRWYAAIGYMGRVVACGAWEPAAMAYNALPFEAVRLVPGTYALVLSAVDEQARGDYWVVLATPGDMDIYTAGELLQWQVDGDNDWGAYPGQDVYGVIDVVGAGGLWLALGTE